MKQRKNAESEPVRIKKFARFIAISGLPACLNPDPDSRLTSIVKVVGLSSNPFFLKSVKDKSMENFYFIGVDVSKKKLDFCVMFEGKVVHEEEAANHQSAIMSLLRHLEEDYGINNGQMLVCAEHTGQYTFPLACACKAVECRLWLENPAEIKYSSGVQRRKNDKVDARRIASIPAVFRTRCSTINVLRKRSSYICTYISNCPTSACVRGRVFNSNST